MDEGHGEIKNTKQSINEVQSLEVRMDNRGKKGQQWLCGDFYSVYSTAVWYSPVYPHPDAKGIGIDQKDGAKKHVSRVNT